MVTETKRFTLAELDGMRESLKKTRARAAHDQHTQDTLWEMTDVATLECLVEQCADYLAALGRVVDFCKRECAKPQIDFEDGYVQSALDHILTMLERG